MSSIQERLQMKRVPLDKWSTKEKLCLASSVACSGDQNWMSVSRSLKMLCGNDRPSDWFAQKSCAAQYGKLLENVETPKRKKRTASERDGVAAVETPSESILRKLTQERIIELKKIIQEESQQYTKVKEDIILIQSGVTDESKLREMWKQIEQERATKEKEQIQHAQWLKEREEKKLELERQWRPMYPNSPTASNKAPTPPIKIKEETDEDSQGSCKSGMSPLLTSLLKNASGTAGTGSTGSTSQQSTGRTASPTITNLLTGSSTISAKLSLASVGEAGQNGQSKQLSGPSKQDSSSSTSATKPTTVKEEQCLGLEVPTASGDGLETVKPTVETDSIKAEVLDVEMDSEDNADPAKDLLDVFEDLIPDDLDEILKENSGMILEDVDLKNVVDSIMEADDEALKDKELDVIEDDGDVQMADVEEKLIGTAPKNEQSTVESAGTPPPQPLPAKPSPNDDPPANNDDEVNGRPMHAASKSVEVQQLASEPLNQDESDPPSAKVEIIPIEDSTSNSPATIPSSDDNKDSMEEASGADNAESVIIVSDSAKEEEEDDDPEELPNCSSNEVRTNAEDDDSDDKPLASLDHTTVDSSAQAQDKLKDDDKSEANLTSSIAQDGVETEDISAPSKDVKVEQLPIDSPSLPADEAKAKKEAMEKLASEYDFKDDEEPIVPMSIQKAKEEKHVSEDEVFEDAQETSVEPEDTKEHEPPVKKSVPEDQVLTVTDTDDDSLIEMKIGKAKRDYSRRRQTDEAQKLKDDLPGYTRHDETAEGRSLRKLRDRDRSESPYVIQDDEANEKMKRSYSSTPVMDSIPGSPASSEDRDHRAWKKSILAVHSRISVLKNAVAFQKPLPDDQITQLIYRPMDLAQIRRNIENGNIRTTVEFQRDIMLMCTNAIMLNRAELCPPHTARMLMRESVALIETGMDPKAIRERESDRGTHKRSSRKSTTRNSSAGRNQI